ncbi:MAG: hypothetical protein V3V99_04390 [candidate division Zixibacteria bacterium]
MSNSQVRQNAGVGILDKLRLLISFFRYNANHVFAGKFKYFLFLSLALFLTIVVIYTIEENTPPTAEDIYYFLYSPGLLLIFYPAAYAIQRDTDSRMIETIFGIPDYRYKVWLARCAAQYIVTAGLLLIYAIVCQLALADFNIWSMVYHIMFPLLFVGSFGFMVSTFIKNGNGTAAILVVFLLIYNIITEDINANKWDIFYNPFESSEDFAGILQTDLTLYNRIYLIVGSILMTLMGLLKLQNREKFI